MTKGVIYKYTSPSNKIYIGQTVREVDRREKFLNQFQKYSGGGKLENARQKYNPRDFQYEILEVIEKETEDEVFSILDLLEEYYIDKFDSYKNGYNSTKGGQYDKLVHCSKVPKQVSQYSLEGKFIKVWNSINDIVNYYNCDKSTISACCLNKRNTAINFIWKYKNDLNNIEINQRINNGSRKRIVQLSLNNEILNTFNTTKEAANAVGLKSHSSISDCCNGKIKTSKGYKWKYEK